MIITLVESIIYNETGDIIYIKFVLTYNSELLTFHGLMTPLALLSMVITGLCNSLLPGGTKPLP